MRTFQFVSYVANLSDLSRQQPFQVIHRQYNACAYYFLLLLILLVYQQDCYMWPDNSTDRTIKKTVRLKCYDKWARHLDPKNLKEKSKANNITGLSLMPPLLELHSKMPAFIKQHLPEKKVLSCLLL